LQASSRDSPEARSPEPEANKFHRKPLSVPFHPALAVSGVDGDLAMAVALDHDLIASESLDDGVQFYFSSPGHRDAAATAIGAAWPSAMLTAREVDDGDWARRSQEKLGPVTVGRITVRPSHAAPGRDRTAEVVILPSMGFGTGHHATTRLCLAGLQRVPLEGWSMLDVGTGSGVLAFAARALGALSALGIDNDPDAVQNARDNEVLNPTLDRVSFRLCELGRDPLPQADVVTANLTGASLCRSAGLLLGATSPGGYLIVSGLLIAERADVQQAFGLVPVWEAFEDEWAVLCFTSPDSR